MDGCRLTIEFEAHFENVNMARAALQGISSAFFGHDRESAADLVMASNEAMNNAVEHTDSTTIRLEVICHKNELEIHVISEGPGFDPVPAAAAIDEHDLQERDEGGYGLYLIYKLVDRFEYEYQNPHNIWKLIKRISLCQA